MLETRPVTTIILADSGSFVIKTLFH